MTRRAHRKPAGAPSNPPMVYYAMPRKTHQRSYKARRKAIRRERATRLDPIVRDATRPDGSQLHRSQRNAAMRDGVTVLRDTTTGKLFSYVAVPQYGYTKNFSIKQNSS